MKQSIDVSDQLERDFKSRYKSGGIEKQMDATMKAGAASIRARLANPNLKMGSNKASEDSPERHNTGLSPVKHYSPASSDNSSPTRTEKVNS